MSTQIYDYAIVGAGAAGLNLAMKMAEDPFFKEKKVLIIDPDGKKSNDRTWSFWEKGTSKWDDLTEKQWTKAKFHGDESEIAIDMGDYVYKTIRSSRFYSHAKNVLAEAPLFDWIQDEVTAFDGQLLEGTKGHYRANYCFDSRIDAAFQRDSPQYATLTQHFMGWFIEVPNDHFDEDTVTMMDYRLKWKDHTSFTYVLPFSPRLALVEFTLFNNELLTKEEYEEKLRFYIRHYLKLEEYTIKEVEVGAIPMSTYPFHKHHNKNLTKIGTAGGWVRPSSGYSFKNADRYSRMIIDNLKQGKIPHYQVATSRFRLYDKIFLRVLHDRNDLGEEIFQTLYSRRDSDALFRFLDEQSSILEDVQIMLSLNKSEFRKALLKTL